ncbi:MAG: DUF3623 family protein [Pseudomonadota bacterium]
MMVVSAVLIAIAAWWISTGLVIMIVRRTGGHQLALALSSVTALGGLIAIWFSRDMVTPTGIYLGFFGALALWAWHEVTFLTGKIVGPRRMGLSASVEAGTRFRQAFLAIRDHELALFATGLLLVVAFAGSANPTGWLIYSLMWVMRLSTKLNVFFGAPNAVSEILPARLAYLTSYFRTDRTHSIFIVSIALITALMTGFVFFAAQSSGAEAIIWTLLASFSALALLEHLFLVLPVRDAALWWWAVGTKNNSGAVVPAHLKKKQEGKAAGLVKFAEVGS